MDDEHGQTDGQLGQAGSTGPTVGASPADELGPAHQVDAVGEPGHAEPASASLPVDELVIVADGLKPIVEALIFASPEPLTPRALYKLLPEEPRENIMAAVEALKRDYEQPGGLQLVEVAGGYQIVTRPELHEWVRKLFHERTSQRLTIQALETLAVIAYRQPITALEIAEVRGVNTSGVIGTLLERHLVKIVGRKHVVGRPFMYATTKEFLIRFGLNDLSDLPKVEDVAHALGFDAPLLVEQAPAEDELPAEEPEAQADMSGGSVH